MNTPDIIVPGKENGEGMVVYHQTSRGMDIFGMNMAINEILAHLELLEECDDIHFIGKGRDIVEWAGSTKHVAIIGTHTNSCPV